MSGLVLLLASMCPPYPAHSESLLGKVHADAVKESLAGEWVADLGKRGLNLLLTSDGRFLLDGKQGQFVIEKNILKLQTQKGEGGYQFDLAGDVLTLTGGDLGQPLKLVRRSEIGGYLGRLFDFSPRSAKLKLQRILVILGIMIVSGLFIAGLRMLSHLVIYSKWGPLKYIFTHHKSRVMTIQSLVLNVVKYVVYFTAFGFVLSELGVNYKAYLASLSVVGLAIGFGSQGLVQDIVTGFFLIFEGQFEVGDMVEISGQTGIVEELGLRVTKLRNYLGQLITIPNRNIAMVGTYTKGALQAYIDFGLTDEDMAVKCSEELQKIGTELSRQFKGIILSNPQVLSPLSLETGEHFVRMQFEIWPQQQWVIDQQVVPRVREILKREGIEIPADRIVSFYHAREERTVMGWGELLGKTGRPT
jgi:small-conductance mechanosensitive channel